MINQHQVSDEYLVEVVRSEDKQKYALLVRRYQDKLVRYVTMLVGNEDWAYDAVQNTFIKAYQNLHGFNTKKKFSSWIYRIAHNEAINIAKKHKKEVFLDDKVWERQFQDKDNLEAELIIKENKTQVNQCLSDLPFKYREPLILYFIDERSYEEISDILRLPMGTVATRINRGKKYLAKICLKAKVT